MNIQEVMLVLGIAGLALWRRALPFYIIASICVYFVGSLWFDTAWQYGVCAMLLATFLAYRGVLQAVRGPIQY